MDADPNPTLATTLGYPHPITPLLENAALIEEGVGKGGLIHLNPKVDDLLARFGVKVEGMTLLVLGGIRGGRPGLCPVQPVPSFAFSSWRLWETLIVDLEAGIEHLGRASAQGVDALLVVVDPDRRSLDTTRRILALAQEIGIPRVYAVGNKARSEEDLVFVKEGLPCELLGMIPFSPQIQAGARFGRLPEVFVSEAAELFFLLGSTGFAQRPRFPVQIKTKKVLSNRRR